MLSEREREGTVTKTALCIHHLLGVMADFGNLLRDALQQDDDQLPLSGLDAVPEDEEYEQLKNWWVQELASPGDLMPYNDDIMSMHLELLDGQEHIIEELLSSGGGSDNSSGDDGDVDASSHVALEVSVYRTEMDRLRFLLADLTRTRLAKIERFALYIRGSEEMLRRLSKAEV